jgi:hypothetical protein
MEGSERARHPDPDRPPAAAVLEIPVLGLAAKLDRGDGLVPHWTRPPWS